MPIIPAMAPMAEVVEKIPAAEFTGNLLLKIIIPAKISISIYMSAHMIPVRSPFFSDFAPQKNDVRKAEKNGIQRINDK